MNYTEKWPSKNALKCEAFYFGEAGAYVVPLLSLNTQQMTQCSSRALWEGNVERFVRE